MAFGTLYFGIRIGTAVDHLMAQEKHFKTAFTGSTQPKCKIRHLYHYCLLALVLLLTACTTPGQIQPDHLRPFRTDGCSHYPEGTVADPIQWKTCCVDHDRAYWAGGDAAERRAADARLKQCIKGSDGGRSRAHMMWLGVRMGGTPRFPSRFRWGFGWPYYRGYKSISPQEQAAIDEMNQVIDNSAAANP